MKQMVLGAPGTEMLGYIQAAKCRNKARAEPKSFLPSALRLSSAVWCGRNSPARMVIPEAFYCWEATLLFVLCLVMCAQRPTLLPNLGAPCV